jgi:hypothetical protein
MKTALLTLAATLILASTALAQVDVQGHWKDTNRDGIKDTYVQPYHRTVPNDTRMDNYGTRPNYNPYTGSRGTENPNPNPYQPVNPYGSK